MTSVYVPDFLTAQAVVSRLTASESTACAYLCPGVGNTYLTEFLNEKYMVKIYNFSYLRNYFQLYKFSSKKIKRYSENIQVFLFENLRSYCIHFSLKIRV